MTHDLDPAALEVAEVAYDDCDACDHESHKICLAAAITAYQAHIREREAAADARLLDGEPT
jgi:hypothetical protein